MKPAKKMYSKQFKNNVRNFGTACECNRTEQNQELLNIHAKHRENFNPDKNR